MIAVKLSKRISKSMKKAKAVVKNQIILELTKSLKPLPRGKSARKAKRTELKAREEK